MPLLNSGKDMSEKLDNISDTALEKAASIIVERIVKSDGNS